MTTFADRNVIQNSIISSFERDNRIPRQLEIGAPYYWTQTQLLRIPQISRDRIQIDREANQVVINVDAVPVEADSASSINDMVDLKIKINDLRKFAHDYTFEIIAENTDIALSTVFPKLFDKGDRLTPDMILQSLSSIIIIEFSTTRAYGRRALDRSYQNKMFKYDRYIRDRIVESNRRNPNSAMKYGYTPLICSDSAVYGSGWLHLTAAVVNELCARYRFTLNLLDVLVEMGVKIEDDDITQIQTNILSQITEMIPEWQEDIDAHAAFTESRIITDDIPYLSTLSSTESRYIKAMMTQLDKLSSDPNLVTYGELMSRFRASNQGIRYDKKSILQLPGLLPDQNLEDWTWSRIGATTDLEEFVDQVITGTQLDTWSHEDSYDDMIQLAMQMPTPQDEKERISNQRAYKRVIATPSDDLKLEHAKVGVQAKDQLHHIEVTEYREWAKESFSIDSDTTDITEFIKRKEELDGSRLLTAELFQIMALLRKARKMNMEFDEDDAFGAFRNIISTPLFKLCNFLSSIGTELAISIKQNVDKDEWVVKKLKHWNCYLIIKPTNSNSHVFYQVVMPLSSNEVMPIGICKHYTVTDGYIIYPFMSYSTSKLSNLLRCDAFLISMVSQWSRYYGLSVLSGWRDDRVWTMSKLCLLINLEDKPKTEEIFTQMRYISMEKFSQTTPDNIKMFEKMPTILRSRLQVWATKKMFTLMSSPNYESTKEDVKDLTGKKDNTKWLNMMNPYTDEIINNPAQLVELYYIGYATNKDAKSWDNTEFDLVKKIVQYDMKLYDTNPIYCGLDERQDDDEWQFHEWSRESNCAAADHLRAYFQEVHAGAFDSRINLKISYRLSQITWEEIATLKASSKFDPSIRRSPEKSGKYHTTRIKALIASLRVMGELEDTPMLSITKVLNWVNSDGGLRVDIFKKNQHGGLREIYVLEIRSRILQLCLEEISRAVCQDIPIEMMMHPENKIRKPQEHMYQSAIKNSKFKSNISSSNDAKVWNQGHHVAKFAQFLVRLLPDKWSGLIINGLKQWTKKRIALPDGVMNYLSKNALLPLADPIHEEIRLTFLGQQHHKWLSEGSDFLLIESGMMQGILHYTSSLYHSAVLMLRDNYWHRFASRMSIKSSTTDLVSSDDSSRMTDIFSDEKSSHKSKVFFARADHLGMVKFSNYFGIYMSPKSTMCCSGVMEFNSEFFFRASLYRPTLKWAYASLSISEVESISERSETMYNQITELLEGGSGFQQAYMTQLSQSLIHYRLLGSGVNPLFLDYANKLIVTPDPSLGFFLIDHSLAPGLPGYSYLLWNAITNSDDLSRLHGSLMRQGEMTSSSTGQITRGVQIRYGDRQKVMRLIEEASENNMDWREEIENNPIFLYTRALTLHHASLKILVKLTSPSVIRSIAKGNALARMVASSVYLINGLSTTIGSNWMSALGEDDASLRRKTSLWMLINLDTSASQPLSEEELDILFPHRDYFINLRRVFNEMKDYILVKHGSTKMLRSHVQVFPEAVKPPFTLEQTCKWRWFLESLPASKSTLLEVWQLYVKNYTWLKDNPKTTLENPDCHFESQIQMRNFIARQGTRSRIIHLTGAPIRDTSTRDLLLVSIINNQIPGYSLVDKLNVGKIQSVDPDGQLLGRIAAVLTYPLTPKVKRVKIAGALNHAKIIWDGSIQRPAGRKMRLAVIQKFINLTASSLSLPLKSVHMKEYIKNSRTGVLGGFTVIQSKVGDLWRGKGVWFGLIGRASVELNFQDDEMTSIVTDSITNLRESEELLIDLAREFGVNKTKHGLGSLYFDLRNIRADMVGCPIHENANTLFAGDISFQSLRMTISGGNLRLKCKINNVDEFTVVSFNSGPNDFKFDIKEPISQYYFKCWVNNASLEPGYAESLLLKGMSEESLPEQLDHEDFKDFVYASFPVSLAKMGWRFSRNALSSALNEEVLESAPSNIAMPGEDFFDIDLDMDFCDMIDEKVTETPELVEPMEYSIYDWLIGDLPLESRRAAVGDIRRVHKYWDDLASAFYHDFSVKEKALLESGYKVSRATSFMRIVTYYTGFEFQDTMRAQSPMKTPSVPSIKEDFKSEEVLDWYTDTDG